MKKFLLFSISIILFNILKVSAQEVFTYTDSINIVYEENYDGVYDANIDHVHIISPPGAKTVEMTFSDFGVNPCDRVYVYDGDNIYAPLIGIYNNNNWPPDFITSSGPSICIRFVTVCGGYTGWIAQVPGHIHQNYVFTDISGYFDDGCGIDEYYSHVNNTYLIKPQGTTQVEMFFDGMDVDYFDDYVYVYDGENENAPLIGVYNNDNYPPSLIRSSGPALFIKFITNMDCNLMGWGVQYRGVTKQIFTTKYNYSATGARTDRNYSVRVVNTSGLKSTRTPFPTTKQKRHENKLKKNDGPSILVYPNPTKGDVLVEMQGSSGKTGKIVLYDLNGHMIISKAINTGTNPIDLNNYPNGTYILKAEVGSKTGEWKIIKE